MLGVGRGGGEAMRKESVTEEKRPVISDTTNQGSEDIVHPVGWLLPSRRWKLWPRVPRVSEPLWGQSSVSGIHLSVLPR